MQLYQIAFVALIIIYIVAQTSCFLFKIYSDRFYAYFHFIAGMLVFMFFFDLTKTGWLSILLLMLISILWEIHEWALWKYFLKKKIFKPRGNDTLNDLFVDFLGGSLIWVLIYNKI